MKSIICYLVFAFLIIGCKQSEEVSSNSKISSIQFANKDASNETSEAPVEAAMDSAASAVMETSPNVSKSETIEPKIIKEGNIRFETNDLEPTYQKIIAAAKKQKATIQNDVEGKDYQSVFRNIVIRVPSQNFDAFIKEISNGVSYFDRKEISSKDVTEEYIDIDARLKAKKILEIRYFELLKKANKVSEMIEIETQLATIREEIDAKEGQLRYMKSRISMSTISIEFYKSVAEESGATISFGSKFWNAIVSGFNSISSFFIGIIQLWPFILIFVLGFYFIRKKIKNKNKL
jgi:Domain of unknown function (DUF4349)